VYEGARAFGLKLLLFLNVISSLRQNVSLGAVKRIVTHPALYLRLPKFLRDLRVYRKQEAQVREKLRLRLYPCLEDVAPAQTMLGYYFYQDYWAARQIFRERPPWVVDIGSTVLLVGILSQYVPCTPVDVRPIEARLEGLRAIAGTAINPPFSDGEVPCLTTMCVLEHIGLGRYGDPISAVGAETAVKEIARVISPGGIVVYSVPVGPRGTLEFNANRRFTYLEAQNFFANWEPVDSAILTPFPSAYSEELVAETTDPVACFCLRKPHS